MTGAPTEPDEIERRFRALRAEPSTDAPRDPARLARVERTREEMLAQGPAIEATLAAEATALAELARRVASRRPRRIVVAGCGDSWLVGTGIRSALERSTGLPVEAVQAYDFARHDAERLDADSVVFGLSASGTTLAVREALAAARERGAFAVGVVGASAAAMPGVDSTLRVHATRRGWPTQSSTAAMVLLAAWGVALARAGVGSTAEADAQARELARLPGIVSEWTPRLDAPMAEIGRRLAGADLVGFAGSGPHFATAGFGAAKIRELGPIHAFAASLEELHHYRWQKPGEPLVVVAPDSRDRERALDTAIVGRGVGATTIALLGTEDPEFVDQADRVVILPTISHALAPVGHSVAVHLLAYHFATARAASP
jgi:glucosamine--fructose-6-phosphate aminotransferase (isomerizing)